MIQLSLERGSEKFDFQSGGCVLLDGYYPEVPGGDEAAVVDSFDLAIGGGRAAVTERVGALNRMLALARQVSDTPDPVYLLFALDEDQAVHRARVLGGSTSLDRHMTLRWKAGKAVLSVAVERESAWEGGEVQIPLSNPNGAGNTAGLPVFGYNDGSGTAPAKIVNYADIDGEDVGGDLPARTRLELTHASAEMMLSRIYIGHNFTDPANAVWTLEAEDADLFGSPVPTVKSVSAASGGESVQFTTLASGLMSTVFKWTLPGSMLSAARGQWVHAVGMFRNSYTVIPECIFQLRFSVGTTVVWESGLLRPAPTGAGSQVRDMFAFRLPPWLAHQSNLASAALSLRVAGAARTLELDFLSLLPADGWRSFEGVNLSPGDRLVDDALSGAVYRDAGPATPRSGGIAAYGQPLVLQPGRPQRLYFMMQDSTVFNQDKTQQLSVKLFARPRRRSI